jgi:hypothetical protein
VTVDEQALARLPVEERGALVDRGRAVSLAEVNAEAAEAAVADAQTFANQTQEEVKAARHQLEATLRAADLARGVRTASGQSHVAEARAAVAAAQAKRQYADRLIEERRARLEVARQTLRLRRATHEWSKVAALQRRGEARGIEPQAFERARREAEVGLAAAERDHARVEGECEEARLAWQARRRGVASLPGGPLPPPPPPERLAPSAPMDGRGAPAPGSSTTEERR